MKVILSSLTQDLDEVVVVGYGTVRKKDVTGSVASVKAADIASVPVASATEAIAGKLAGVQITTTEGSPDAEMKIRVRGGGSITGDNSPLFIVDGFPVESISDIAPTDIESIDVLKDASSTAIYGSRGANGVVIVTTKGGKEGKVSVNYNAYYAWKQIAKTLDVLSPGDYAKWQYELAMLKSDSPNDINPDSYTKYFGNYQDLDMYSGMSGNDWQDQVFGRTGNTFNHNLSINGGNDFAKFAFSYSRMDDTAIMELSNFKRDNFNFKTNIKVHKNVKLDFSARYSKTNVSGGGANEQKEVSSADSRLKHAIIYTPIPISNLETGAGEDEDSKLINPLTSLSDNDRRQLKENFNYSAAFNWDIISNLKLKLEIGLDNNKSNDKRYYGTSTYYAIENGNSNPIAIFTADTRKSLRSTNTLAYDFKKLIKGDNHHLNAMVGQEYITTSRNVGTDEVRQYPEFFTANDAFTLTTQGTPYSTNKYIYADDILLSYFGRVNYDYKSKYLFSGTFRADGSSKFSEGNRWGYFPSAAVAWRLSSESFFEDTKDWLDDLKLRLSYGTAGNNNIPSDQTVAMYVTNTTGWVNDNSNYWSTGKTMVNPDLKWETTVTRNIGVDFSFFNSRISGSLEAYWNNTKDLLIEFPVPGTGYDTQYRNMGETENKGYEASLNFVVVDKKNFGLTIGANAGVNKNKIKSLGSMSDMYGTSNWASTEIGSDYIVRVGGSVGEIFGYQSDGRYEVSDFERYDETSKKWILKDGVADASAIVGTIRPGSMKLKNTDQSADNKITQADRSVIGNANPKATGGFNISARAYGFDLAANFTWSYGNDVYNANKIEYTSSSKYQFRNMIDIMRDGSRWTNLRADGTISNDMEELAAMNANTTMWSPYGSRYVLSDWAVEDGSFLRLSTLTLGYTLPRQITNKVKIQSLRFYATGYNLFCWTNYSGFDPEVSTRRRTALTPGVDYSAYPKSRQFVIGANLTF